MHFDAGVSSRTRPIYTGTAGSGGRPAALVKRTHFLGECK
jgi:hypothetical protein